MARPPSPSPVVLVTGANRGIGLEVCRQLEARGATVLAASRRREEPPHGHGLVLDVTEEAGVARAVQQIGARWGHLDGLINNAAILLDQGRSVVDLAPEVLRATLETNLLGPLRVAQAAWPLLRDGAFVVNVSSLSGQFAEMDDWAPGYSLSKAALNALTLQLSLAGKARGIRVNSVCPGWARTGMGGEHAPRSAAEAAEGIVWLALDAPPTATGLFFRDRRSIPW